MNSDQTDLNPRLPEARHRLALLLEERGYATYWVGEGLTRAAIGKEPLSYSFVTSATPEQIIAALPTAVPTRSDGLSFVVPSPDGPTDLAPLGPAETIEENLNGRGFRALAMAWRPSRSEWIDPHSGQKDLEEGQLGCIHTASQDLSRSPLRVLQAARLISDLALRPEAPLEAAMGEAYREGSPKVPTCNLRNELKQLLICEDPTAGIELLRVTGVDQQLGVGGREDAGPLMALMPPELPLRWTVWLRESTGTRPLRKLRVDSDTTSLVQRLSASHPIEERFPQRRGRTLRKRCQQMGEENCKKLIRLRTEELRDVEGDAAEGSRIALRKLAETIAAEPRQAEEERQRVEPVIGGQEIMEILKCPPGPQIGAALAFLRKHIAAHPDENTEEKLKLLLQDWSP